MTLATKNGAIILKDGKLAENCGCCESGWYCYPSALLCNVCPSLPSSITLSLSFPQISTFYLTLRNNTAFGVYYRNMKWSPSITQSDFVLTKDSAFIFPGLCTYSFNAGPVGVGANSGRIAQADGTKSMFSMAVGSAAPSAWAGGQFCQQRYAYPFGFHQMTLLIGGAQYAKNTQAGWFASPGSPSFVAPEDDEYETANSAVPVHFMFGYNRPTSLVYDGWYAINGEVASSGGCQVRLERPFSGTITVPFFYGKHTGNPGFGEMSLSLAAA